MSENQMPTGSMDESAEDDVMSTADSEEAAVRAEMSGQSSES